MSDFDAPRDVKRPSRERTRDAILAAAISLYRHEGYGAVTMRAIAQQLGFSAPAIYNYFLSKEEIFLALQARGLQILADTVITPSTGDPVADVKAVFLSYYQFTKQHPEYFTMMYVDPSTPPVNMDNDAFKAMVRETTDRLQRCIDAGIVPPVPIPTANGLLWNSVHGSAVLRQLQRSPADTTAFEMLAVAGVEILFAAFRNGLLPDAVAAADKSARGQ